VCSSDLSTYMQTIHTTLRRVPQNLFRISKPTATTTTATKATTTRALSQSTPKMSLFPRFTQEFAPLFRLMDDYDRRIVAPNNNHNHPNRNNSLFRELRSFTPKFDVKEVEDAYELHGEFPGVEQKDINIEWTDANTLTISGRHEVVREEGTRPSNLIDNGNSSQGAIKEAGESHSSKQPTVEDADQPEGGNKEQQVTTTNTDNQEVAKNQPKYWVSERSVGEFHRSFSFPSRVDQDNVKASLKNGILSVVVPKAKAPTPRKVEIQ